MFILLLMTFVMPKYYGELIYFRSVCVEAEEGMAGSNPVDLFLYFFL